ncbi:hypothetical protein PHYPSEUDO_001374 [Phytophthora pseudosyringae]|uniref:Myb/SANT-like domain-containing protein n=1 Tax=Phytophthora pseudosyringae TaxID=221518 RepID=A0A8T1WJR2_9STRA|nr:hypothetical protein PHYPSEUDO_001374 [Phytophthora pseudosyringae]
MSEEITKQVWGHQRAVWDVARESVLLEVFYKTRQDPALRTDRGLKVRGWNSVAEQVNDRCKSTFNVDQLRSKYARLMMDYELFQDVGGERNLSDKAWDKLILDLPENAKRLQLFKESGFPHDDVCRRISIEKDELAELKQEKASPQVTMKRSSGPIGELPDAKRARMNAEQLFRWSPREEKLVLFLCWRAKVDREKSAEGETKPQVWSDVTKELNGLCKTKFNEEQFKNKYLQLMQSYEQSKHVTGFSGDIETTPNSDKDWDKLIADRPQFSLELQRLKEKGGFPHVEVCSLISGDKSIEQVEPASVTEFLVTGALQRSEVKSELNTESINAVATAQASLSANALSQLLPAAATAVAASELSDTTGQLGTAAAVATPAAAAVPAVMTHELHDNFNMFLKTATAYLVMAINDHNQESSQ